MSRTLGIDLASRPASTALCVIAWEDGRAVVEALELGADDPRLLEVMHGASRIGIDAPLGWPADFVRAVADPAAWPVAPGGDRRRLERRETDRRVHETTGKVPLSVTTDRIAYPAMRAAGLLAVLARSGVPVDRSGMRGPVCEVYPDPAIRRLGLWPADVPARASYKRGAAGVRERIVAALPPWLAIADADRRACLDADDCLDALICALVARAVERGATEPPPPGLRAAAAVEGWIHVPVPGALERLPG